MPFRLCNAQSTFLRVMNETFIPFLDDFVHVYLGDILVFNRTWEDHMSHVEKVLEVLKKEKMYFKIPKCEFCKTSLL